MSGALEPPSTKDPTYRWKLLMIIMIGTLMAALDQSIVNVSLPAIMADFGSSVDDIEWVITGYMLSFATLMPLTTWFRDKIGHKSLYIGSLVIFTIGSLLCGMAWNLPSLVFARVIQAFGGGAITPTGMAMISEEFPPHERGKALGWWGVGVIVGPAFGPTLGGILTNAVGWRSIFMVNLPIGIIGVILAAIVIREHVQRSDSKTPFDLWGFSFLSLFLIPFLLGLTKGEHEGWTSPYIVTCFLLSTLGFIGFLTVESLVSNAIIDIRLFKYPVFSACMIVTAMRSVALFGGTFLLPLFLQQLMGLDEIDSGLVMLPGSLVIGVLMPFAGKLSDRMGPRLPSIVGLAAVAYFMFMYRNLDVNMSQWEVIYPTLIRGVGIGLLIAPIMAAAINSVPKNKVSMASSMLNLIQQVAGSIGIAILGTVLSHRTHFHMASYSATLDPKSPEFIDTFHRWSEYARQFGFSHADAARVAQSAIGGHLGALSSQAGFQDAFLFGGWIVFAGIFASFLLPKGSVGSAGEHAIME